MINNRYEIIEQLGKGRSTVYLCSDIEFHGKQYAIKILPTGIDDIEKKSFIKEYFILKKLEHPYIIRPFGLGTIVHKENEENIEVGSSFMTLEFFEGQELLSSKEICKEENLREIAKQICLVLYYLHQSRYIYYDLKPENILVSYKNDKPQIKVIDLGLAEYSPSSSNYEIKGTAHYIAPELLKKENHNHSVDFYSLGIILYRIIYNQFPSDAQTQLDIYKAAIKGDFNFPPIKNYSPELIDIIKKLLEKDIAERYTSAFTIINDLGFSLDTSVTKEFVPAKVFTSRDYVVNSLTEFISDDSSSEVFSVKGFDGVGKTSLLHQVREIYPEAILISDIKIKTGGVLLRYILGKIIFSSSVFPKLLKEDKELLIQLMNKDENQILDDLRSTIILLSSQSKFILLIDDINLFDQFTANLLLEIIPILQVNNVKVIISESSEQNYISSRLNNIREIILGPFTEKETTKFLNTSYSDDFPKKQFNELILSYSDLMPGNIKSFIKDLILLGIIRFSEDGVSISDEADRLSILNKTHVAIYDLRLANLSEKELHLAKVVSALDMYINAGVLSKILDISETEIKQIILNLEFNNIIQEYTSGQMIIFSSEAIKKHIYSSIENKKEFHLQIARKLTDKVQLFSRLEIARQYELAGEYESCYNVLMKEVSESEKHSVFKYIRNILIHLSNLPLEKKLKNIVLIKLSEVYYNLGDMKSALNTVKNLKIELTENEWDKKLSLIEGIALIVSGAQQAGKAVLVNLLERINDNYETQRIKVELAFAEFELKNYEEARKQCDSLLNDKNLTPELKGRCHNLKGMIDIYQYNDTTSALENFQNAKKEFEIAEVPGRISGAEVNIGNIFNILANYEYAEKHWKNALRINQSIGNLDQEANLLQNFGLFYLDRQKYDLAIDSYKKSQSIFLSIGKASSSGLILINLGEVYLKICDYQKSFESLKAALKIFKPLNNLEEISESLTLLCKLYFSVGYAVKFEETLNSFEVLLNKVELPVKYHINFQYLNLLIKLLKNERVLSKDARKLVDEYKKIEERNSFVECKFLIINLLIREENYEDACKQVLDNEFIDLCSQNSILAAEREYFLGIISKNYESDKLLPAIMYFENAYELLRDENVIELTWKITFMIAEFYMERGNINKAKRFIVYTRELIYFIAEKIVNPRLRAAYLKQNERLITLQRLEKFYPSY